MFTCSGCRSAAASTATRAPTPSPRRLQRSRRRASQRMSGHARPPERLVAVGDRSSFSVKYAPAPRRPLVRVRSQQYLCRIGKNPTEECQQCSDNSRFAGRCIACREEEGTKRRVILRCRPLGELWDGAFCGSAPSFPVRRRTVRSEVADCRVRDLVITVETVISEVAQFITCCKCKTFLELHSY